MKNQLTQEDLILDLINSNLNSLFAHHSAHQKYSEAKNQLQERLRGLDFAQILCVVDTLAHKGAQSPINENRLVFMRFAPLVHKAIIETFAQLIDEGDAIDEYVPTIIENMKERYPATEASTQLIQTFQKQVEALQKKALSR